MPDPSPVWNSLEVAKLVVSALTPLTVAILGLYLARRERHRTAREAKAQQRIEAAHRALLSAASAGERGHRVLLRSCYVRALFRLDTETPGLQESIEETKQLYRRDYEAFLAALSGFREAAMLVRIAFGPASLGPFQRMEQYLTSLLRPDHPRVAEVEAALLEVHRQILARGSLGDAGPQIASRSDEILAPLRKEFERLSEELMEFVSQALDRN